MGIPISDDSTLYTLHFGDDQVVLAFDKAGLEYMIKNPIEEYERWDLEVNTNKTKYMSGGKARFMILKTFGTIKHAAFSGKTEDDLPLGDRNGAITKQEMMTVSGLH
ncbi:hypothetical protein ILUMI_22046 [Ignelater luminosus]|uniref:Uncharacterized protein n=1 Tax=Ignelater luminosus TaxID=2038154 RepID=A0A8K0CF96_IGNLU|nr:hypothetical protein ILUMI_22046 [Ignelater luminosus]